MRFEILILCVWATVAFRVGFRVLRLVRTGYSFRYLLDQPALWRGIVQDAEVGSQLTFILFILGLANLS